MSNTPLKVSTDELKEIYELVGYKWGLEFESLDEFAGWADAVYAVKFRFHSGAPGYVGDLFIVQGDALTGHPPIMLIRDKADKLVEA